MVGENGNGRLVQIVSIGICITSALRGGGREARWFVFQRAADFLSSDNVMPTADGICDAAIAGPRQTRGKSIVISAKTI